jgi:hypothetical protein
MREHFEERVYPGRSIVRHALSELKPIFEMLPHLGWEKRDSHWIAHFQKESNEHPQWVFGAHHRILITRV